MLKMLIGGVIEKYFYEFYTALAKKTASKATAENIPYYLYRYNLL